MKRFKDACRNTLTFILTFMLLAPSSSWASAPKLSHRDHLRISVEKMVKKIQKEKLGVLIKDNFSKNPKAFQQAFEKELTEENITTLNQIKFSSYYGEFGLSLKYKDQLLTFDFTHLPDGTFLFNGTKISLSSFKTTEGINSLKNLFGEKKVSLLNFFIEDANASPILVISGITILLVIGGCALVLDGLWHSYECGQGSENESIIEEAAKLTQCCSLAKNISTENQTSITTWITTLMTTSSTTRPGPQPDDEIAYKNGCQSGSPSQLSYFNSKTVCSSIKRRMASVNNTYEICKDSNDQLLEALDECVKEAQNGWGYPEVGCDINNSYSGTKTDSAPTTDSGARIIGY